MVLGLALEVTLGNAVSQFSHLGMFNEVLTFRLVCEQLCPVTALSSGPQCHHGIRCGIVDNRNRILIREVTDVSDCSPIENLVDIIDCNAGLAGATPVVRFLDESPCQLAPFLGLKR